MLNLDVENQFTPFEGIHVCPICRKMFTLEKELYRHVIHAHQDKQYMSYDLHADLYERWQERIPKPRQ
jgi:hypothetical protein